jgi:hypothetical protein
MLVAVLTVLALARHLAAMRAPGRRPDRDGERGLTDAVESEEGATKL